MRPTVALRVSWVLLRDAHGEPLNTVLFAKDLSEKLKAQRGKRRWRSRSRR